MLCSEFLKRRPIGVFDSGLGGISVLSKLKKALPCESFVYFSDSANAPYGSRSRDEIIELSKNAMRSLLSVGCKAVVIACNTVTSVAIETLRTETDLPVIGLEPAIKPAIEFFPEGNVLLLATPVTLKYSRIKSLIADAKASVTFVSAPELVTYVERGEIDGACALAYLKYLLSKYKGQHFDACVLGCSHFPFAKKIIVNALGYEPCFFDGASGVAKRLKNELLRLDLLNDTSERGTVLWNEIYQNNLQTKLLAEYDT